MSSLRVNVLYSINLLIYFDARDLLLDHLLMGIEFGDGSRVDVGRQEGSRIAFPMVLSIPVNRIGERERDVRSLLSSQDPKL